MFMSRILYFPIFVSQKPLVREYPSGELNIDNVATQDVTANCRGDNIEFGFRGLGFKS